MAQCSQLSVQQGEQNTSEQTEDDDGSSDTLKQCPNGGDVFQWTGVGWKKEDSETLSVRILKDEQGFGKNECGEYHSMGKQEKVLQSI